MIEAKLAEFKAVSNPPLAPTPAATGGGGSGTSTAAGGVAGPSRAGVVEGSGAGSMIPPVPPPPVPVPHVDPLYLQQLCDMGFERNHAEEALVACGNDLPTAMEWILSHPPSSTEAVSMRLVILLVGLFLNATWLSV